LAKKLWLDCQKTVEDFTSGNKWVGVTHVHVFYFQWVTRKAVLLGIQRGGMQAGLFLVLLFSSILRLTSA
jgi:hypothetical protein